MNYGNVMEYSFTNQHEATMDVGFVSLIEGYPNSWMVYFAEHPI